MAARKLIDYDLLREVDAIFSVEKNGLKLAEICRRLRADDKGVGEARLRWLLSKHPDKYICWEASPRDEIWRPATPSAPAKQNKADFEVGLAREIKQHLAALWRLADLLDDGPGSPRADQI